MRKSRKFLFTLAGAALLLAAAVGSASGQRLSVSEDTYLITWRPLRFLAAGTTTTCNVTLHGSFHRRTIRKVLRSLIGMATRAIVNNCIEGTATILTATLPWHVTYGGFRGILPRITSTTINLIGASFRVDPAGELPACLARTETNEPGVGIASVDTATGQVDEVIADPLAAIDLEGFICDLGGDSFFEGRGSVHSGDHRRLVFIRLI